MKNSNLLQFFHLLSAKERERFQDFVHSPFFNKSKKIQRLCSLILEGVQSQGNSDLSKQQLHADLFEGLAYNELQINNVISDLLQLGYRFLAMIHFEKEEALNKSFTAEELLERGQTDLAAKVSRSFAQTLDKVPYRNCEFHQSQYLLHDKMVRYHLSTNMRARDKHLQQQSDSFDLYYFSNKLRIACDMISRNITTSGHYQCHFLEELLPYYESNFLEYQHHPSLHIYYHILKLVQDKKEEQYQYLKSYIRQQLHHFPKAELRFIYLYLQNYCVYQINSGKSIYYQELRDMYDLLLQQEIIFYNGFLQESTYKNIVTTGIRLSDYDWTESIIHQYKDKLPPEDRNNAVVYNLAALYYARRQYKPALQQLHNVEFTDTSYHVGAKIIQLKSYYELGETEALYALIEAFKKYILRNKDLVPYHKNANANFLRLVKKVYQLKSSKGRSKKAALAEKRKKVMALLETLEPVANLDWLRGKVLEE
jgi:hypothetical protein